MKQGSKIGAAATFILAVFLWSFMPSGVFFLPKIKVAQAVGTMTAVTVAPETDGVDNLIGQSGATWNFTVDNATALTALDHAVFINFSDGAGNFNLSNITATSTVTGGDELTFATTSLPIIGVENNTIVVMPLTSQTSAANDFTISLSGLTNPANSLEAFNAAVSFSVYSCTLAVSGNPNSGCASIVDSLATNTALLKRRGGAITVGSLTAANYAASAVTEYTISFTASTTLNIGEKIWVNFPDNFNINNATTSAQNDINGAGDLAPRIASEAIATTSANTLNAVVLTTSNAAVAAGDTITVLVGNIVNATKGSYQNVRFFTTTTNDGLIDGTYFGMDQQAQQNGPPPVESIQIGGDNTITGTIKVREANGTLRTVTAEEAAQLQVGMGCPDLMFFVGTKQVASDGTFSYSYVLNATYVLFVQPFSETSTFFESYLSPNMMMVNVTGDETVTLTPTFEVPDSFIAGTVSGGPASYNDQMIEVRAYTPDLQSFHTIFTSTAYTTEGLNASGVGYFRIPVRSGNTWKMNFETSDLIFGADGSEYWTPTMDPVYVPDTSTVTTTATAFVQSNKELRVYLRNSTDNSIINSGFCISVRRSGQEMMGPMMGNEICNASGDYYTMTVPAGPFAVQVMGPGRGNKEYPILIASGSATTTKTIIMESASNYISGTVLDPDSFPMQGVTVFAQGTNGSFNQALTNASGVYTIYVPPGTYTLKGFTQGYGPLTPITNVNVTNSNVTGKNFSISAGNFKTIQGRVYTDTNTNNVYNAGVDTPYQGVQIHAYGAAGGNGTQTRSDGSYTLRVPAAAGYTVSGWHEDIGDLTPVTGVDVSSGNATGQDFKVGASGYLEIRIVDGNVASLSPVFAGAFSSSGKGNGSDSFNATTSDPVLTNIDDLVTKFSLPAGSYNVRVGTPAYGELTSLAANAGVRTVEITVGALSGLTINLPTLYTLSGTALANANVWASNTTGPGKYNTTADANGDYAMKIPAGTFMIGANLTGYINSPQEQTIAAETNLDLTLTAAAATITGAVSSGGVALTEGFIWAVKSSNQGWTGTEISADGSYSLSVDDGTWIVYAEGPCYYQSAGAAQTGSGTVNISLTSISGCTFEAPEAQSIVPSAGGKISQADVEVTIPANALGTGSSAVSVNVAKPNFVPPSTLSAAPLSNAAKSITATNSSGTSISSLNNSMKIVMTYSDADIPNGSSENNLQLAYWNTTSSSWEPVAATLDTTNNTLTASVTHLTDFAPVLPTGDDTPTTPAGLAVGPGNPPTTALTLSWTQVSGATGYYLYRDTTSGGNFPLLVHVSGGTTLSYNNTGLSAGTRYYYKITSANANGESAASSAVSATTDSGGGSSPAAGSGSSGSSGNSGLAQPATALPVSAPTESAGPPQSAVAEGAPATVNGTVVVTPTAGGQTSLLTDSGTMATVVIPPAAINAETSIIVTPVLVTRTVAGGDSAAGGTSVVPASPAGSKIVGGQTYNIEATTLSGASVSSLSDSLTLTFEYTESQVSGLDEAGLLVYYFSEDEATWISLASTVDTANNLITAYVDHLSAFAVMGQPTSDLSAYAGKVVKATDDRAVYLISDGYRRAFTSEMMYFSYGYLWSDIVTADVSLMPLGPDMVYSDDNLFTAGQMIKGTDAKVYFIDNAGHRHWVASEEVYLGLGYSWQQVAWISDSALANYETGAAITSAGERPDGSLVKYASGDKVYLIEGSLKRWIKDEASFNGLNYGWYNIIEIPATETFASAADLTEAD